MAYTPGPKELGLRAMKEAKASRGPRPSKTELRSKIANIKGGGKPRKGGGRGR